MDVQKCHRSMLQQSLTYSTGSESALVACWCNFLHLCWLSHCLFCVSWWYCRAFPLESIREPTNVLRKWWILHYTAHVHSRKQEAVEYILCNKFRDCQDFGTLLSLWFKLKKQETRETNIRKWKLWHTW